MTHLYLDNKEVFPQEDLQIKIVRENPVRTKAGTYTMEIVLPMDIIQNRRFFGALSRIEARKSALAYDCRLSVSGQLSIVGTATVTRITNDAVTVQLLAGNSSVNFWNKTDNIYMDEMDYNMEDGVDIVRKYLTEELPMELFGGIAGNLAWETREVTGKMVYCGKGVEGKFCFAPYWDEDVPDGLYKDRGLNRRWGNYFDRPTVSQSDRDPLKGKFYFHAVHPSLMYVLDKVIAYRGYSVIRNDALARCDEMYRNLYIGHARPSMRICDALPHWTIKEFLEEVQKFFNVSIVFDDHNRTASLVANSSVGEEVDITCDVVDEFEVSIGDDAAGSGVAAASIKYVDRGDDVQLLGDITEKYQHEENVNPYQAWSSLGVGSDRNWRFYDSPYGRFCPRNADGAMEYVDAFRMLKRDSSTVVDLKIVPARMAMKPIIGTCILVETDGLMNGIVYHQTTHQYFIHFAPALIFGNSWGGYKNTEGTLYDEISGSDFYKQFGDKEDYINVFLYDFERVDWQTKHFFGMGGTVTKGYSENMKDHSGFSFGFEGDIRDYEGMEYTPDFKGEVDISYFDYGYTDSNIMHAGYSGDRYISVGVDGYSLNLVNILPNSGKRRRYHGMVFEESAPADSKSVLRVEALRDTPPSPNDTYIIRNKRYVCQKVEISISGGVVDRLATLYLVELD